MKLDELTKGLTDKQKKNLKEAKSPEELSGMLTESEKRLTEDELDEVAGGCVMFIGDEKKLTEDEPGQIAGGAFM